MSEKITSVRLSKAAREFNVGISTIIEFLSSKGFSIDSSPNTKLNEELYTLIQQEYSQEKSAKEESIKVGLEHAKLETISLEDKKETADQEDSDDISLEELLITSTSVYGKTPAKKATVKKRGQKDKPAAPIEEAEEITEEAQTAVPVEESVQEEKEDKEPIPVVTAEQDGESEAESADESDTDEQQANEEPAEAPEILEDQNTQEEQSADSEDLEESTDSEDEEDIEKIELPPDPDEEVLLKIHGTVDLDSMNMRTKPRRKTKEQKEEEQRLKKEEEKKRRAAAKGKSKSKEAPITEPDLPEETNDIPATQADSEDKSKEKTPEKKEPEIDKNFLETKIEKLTGPTILGKMDLPTPVRRIKKIEKKPQPVASSDEGTVTSSSKKKRKRIKPEITKSGAQAENKPADKKHKTIAKKRSDPKVAASEEDIQKQIKETLARLSPTGKSKSSKFRRQKREQIHQNLEMQRIKEEDASRIIKVTEFVTVAELASLMNVDVNSIIATCIQLGLFVSINQRLDAETLTIVASEFGHELEFVGIEAQESVTVYEDDPADLLPRNPIVTVMGHVDHGKTSLLDHIRKANVIAGEAGGITQHIGAYEVELERGKKITFLDTPGHEAFTAMRARGAKVTDIAIIVVAADDQVMPQTREAINHAQAAGVPLVFAINKIDKPGANPEKVKEQLASMNLLVEDWGGKYQSHDISAKQGLHVEELLEKVLLEAELLDLKCNPKRPAEGTVIESSLDKGRGFIAKLLVQNGTLRSGDVVIAGCYHGRVKAMYNERNQKIKEAGPGAPVLLLGLHGAPQAGDIFNVMSDEKEAKAIASKRLQLQREQGIRTQKHITLDEIGRRIAIGDFKELNIIVKGDVDGSVEALSDSLMKLSTDQAQVNVIHKSVGAVSETDVMLASASDAIIVAFQVRPSLSARKLAEQEQIDIRIYSIIYQAIDEIKSALEGMLAPDIEEKITSNVEVREVFKITKVGTIAGCMVLDGKINKNSKIRVIRDGIVVYTGKLGSLKRFKDDVKEVSSGYECGLNIDNFNDIKVGDIVESYEETEVKRKL
jgi:translation initiation factor IF-2